MNTPDYLALLRQKKQSVTPLEGTAQTAKSPLRSLCSPPLAHIQPEIPVAALAGADATTIDSVVELPKVDFGNTVTASRWWLIHFLDREPVEVSCTPPATHAEILELHPDAVAAEPFTPIIRHPSATLSAEEEAAIRAWPALIEETDPATIAEVIGQCQRDTDARDYFTGRAAEVPKPDAFPDDRRTCDQCANLIARRCQAAKRGEIMASRNYEPNRDLPRRCESYEPGAADTDRRPGRERWPGLTDMKGVNDGDH